MLFAASQRAFAYATSSGPGGGARGAGAGLGVLSSAVSDASDWDQWREEIKKSPNRWCW
jgi:hypothetical protein